MPESNPLLGSWHLIDWTIHYSDREHTAQPYGDRPQGLILYTDDGWMNAVINRRQRPQLPAGVHPSDIEPDQLALQYRSFFQYAGRYRIEGGTVIHSVTQALNPGMVGTEQHRQVQLAGTNLTLTGIEQIGSSERRHVLQWQREPGAL